MASVHVISIGGETIAHLQDVPTICHVKKLLEKDFSIPVAEQTFVSGESILLDTDAPDKFISDTSPEATVTLVRRAVVSSDVMNTIDHRNTPYRPFQLQPLGKPARPPFFAAAMEEQSTQWRARMMYDQGARVGGLVGIMVPGIAFGIIGGVCAVPLGLVAGSGTVACRTIAGRHLESQWVVDDFTDAGTLSFRLVAFPLIGCVGMPICLASASVGGVLGASGDCMRMLLDVF